MKKIPSISSSELEVLQILWQAGKPLKIQEICDSLQNENWKYNTVGTFLIRMEEKGAVISHKQNRTKYYKPLVNQEDYKQAQTKNLISKLYNGSVKDLAVSLFKSNEMTKEDIAEIRRMFNL
ncbi:MAG: BlaI/MecI/CopY family transcriptional regulator [Bacillota bacterium]|jgi:BlaI family penicillinase repressor